MADRFEPGIELLRGTVPAERSDAVEQLEGALRGLRRCLDALGQSREISLAHIALDGVSFHASAHIMRNEPGTTPGQRGARFSRSSRHG